MPSARYHVHESIESDPPLSPAQILAETRALFVAHGITGWTAKLCGRSTKQYGVCDYRKREVRISRKLAAVNPGANTRDTIAHEVAHVLAGHRAGHGPEWKRQCAVTGARPVACYDASEVVAVPAKYIAHCAACGAEVARRDRMTPKMRNETRAHQSSKCGKRWTSHVERLLVWSDARALVPA